MAREPLHAALAADLERLGHDAAAVAAGTWFRWRENVFRVRFPDPEKRTAVLCGRRPGATLDCRAFAGGRMLSGCVFRTLKNAQRFCVAHAQEQPSADTWVCVLGAWKNALVCSGETCVRFLGPGRTHWGLCACIFGDLEEGTASGLYAMWRPTCVHFRGLEERRLGLNPLAQAQNAA